jgi:hypothetical protein
LLSAGETVRLNEPVIGFGGSFGRREPLVGDGLGRPDDRVVELFVFVTGAASSGRACAWTVMTTPKPQQAISNKSKIKTFAQLAR